MTSTILYISWTDVQLWRNSLKLTFNILRMYTLQTNPPPKKKNQPIPIKSKHFAQMFNKIIITLPPQKTNLNYLKNQPPPSHPQLFLILTFPLIKKCLPPTRDKSAPLKNFQTSMIWT